MTYIQEDVEAAGMIISLMSGITLAISTGNMECSGNRVEEDKMTSEGAGRVP